MNVVDYITIILTAALPVAAISSLFYYLDKNKEPVKCIIRAFVMGIVSVPLTFLLHIVSPDSGAVDDGSFRNSFLLAFYNAALMEEVAKYVVFIAGVYFMRDLDEWYDGILYGVMIGLGFGFVENIMYFLSLYETIGVDLLIHRSIHSMPMHALLGGMMGFYLGKAKFTIQEEKIALFHFLSIIIPIAVHGLFNFVLFYSGLNLSFISIWVVAISWYVVMRKKKISQETKLY